MTHPVKTRPETLAPGHAPPHGYSMESRVAVLEEIAPSIKTSMKDMSTDLRWMREKQESDFRLMFSALIAMSLGLAALMAHGFRWF